ncbi:MAG TPA: hydroxypyruvate isomerase [Oceanospirillaceae bacterium]|nr:hydroxypyruvate isomerase [Oceanospirillaceae bacterium]
MLNLCANISMLFNELPFLQRYQAAADAGFVGVECLFPYDFSIDEVSRAIRLSGIPQVLINTSAGCWHRGDRGMACDARRRSEFEASVRQALQYVAAMGNPLVHVMAGLVPDGVSLDEAEAVYVNNLRWAAGVAKDAGVCLTMEAINPIDMPNYLLSNQAQVLRLYTVIGASNVGIQFDFFHCQKHEGNALEQFKQLLPHISHIQIAGVPERHEPDTGVLDYAPVFHVIEASGYSGYVGCEYRPKTTTLEGLGWMGAMRVAKRS